MPLRRRTEVLKAIITALDHTKAIFGKPPVIIHSDKAKEYLSAAVQEATRRSGTATTTSIPRNPEKNGVAERVNRTFMNGTRCVLATAGMPIEYWPYALRYVVFKHTRIVHHGMGTSPYNGWHG